MDYLPIKIMIPETTKEATRIPVCSKGAPTMPCNNSHKKYEPTPPPTDNKKPKTIHLPDAELGDSTKSFLDTSSSLTSSYTLGSCGANSYWSEVRYALE